jgi:hypothetical protein
VGLAWVLNRLARDERREVAALLAAGDEVRSGMRRAVSGAGAGGLRDAEQVLRDRARALRLAAERLLAAEGRPPAAAALARVELLLRVAATGTDREALREGTLLREPEVGGEDLSGLTVLAGGRGGTRQASATAPSPRPSPPAGAGGEGEVRLRSAKAARAAREREEREARAREDQEIRARKRALDAARAAVARADRRAVQEGRRAEEAERRAREARERAAAARSEADRLRVRVLELDRGK